LAFLKQEIGKWLKRLWALIAAKLIIIAVLLTIARFAISSVDDYKDQLVEWLIAEHDINVDAEKISAGIDLSGIVLTLNNVVFIDSEALPFELKIEHLFLHFDFLGSLRQQNLIFNDISLKGADLLIKSLPVTEDVVSPGPELPTESESTLEALKNIFLLRLSTFSITDSKITFADSLYNNNSLLIQDLTWINQGDHHQGVGKASLPSTLGESGLAFLIDIKGDAEGSNDQLIGSLYAHAENLNATEYLQPKVNPLAALKNANISFKLWSHFDFNGPKSLQFEWGNSNIAWSLLADAQDWQINDGMLQFTFNDKAWLFDSYDLNITHNNLPFSDINVTGEGTLGDAAKFNLTGIDINTFMPFALLFSSLNQTELEQISALQIGGNINQVGLFNTPSGERFGSVAINAFNMQAHDVYPGISNADITVASSLHSGQASIKLGTQEITFDGQFNRSIPLQSADVALHWKMDDNGFEISSDNSSLITDDLQSLTKFTLLFPNGDEADSSPFLSLYSNVSLNDAAKAQHYFPIVAMGQDVYDYLKPTLKKGSITDAQILWNGRFADYPFEHNEGVFQAYVPVKDAEYDFYEDWQGLHDLDLTLLFENDALFMESDKGKLGDINITKLSANIDHLAEDGILTIDTDITENAQSIAKYLIASPLKETVGKVVEMFSIKNNLSGNLSLSIPLAEGNDQTVAKGQLKLVNNAVDINLGSDTVLPLKKVKGILSFTNGNLEAKGLTATLFEQPVVMSFTSEDFDDKYQLDGALSGQWNLSKLSTYDRALLPLRLSGNLDWLGQLNFTKNTGQDYEFALNLTSQMRGVNLNLPAPFNKNSLQAWPSTINVNSNPQVTTWNALVANKMKSSGEITHIGDQSKVKYLYLGLGKDQGLAIDKSKQVLRVSEDQLDLTPWVSVLKAYAAGQPDVQNIAPKVIEPSLINIDDIFFDVTHAELFEQPLVNLRSTVIVDDNKWLIDVNSDQLTASTEYRQGVPERYNINIQKMNVKQFNLDALQASFVEEGGIAQPSSDLRRDYPEIFAECITCVYNDMNLSSLKTHLFPTETRYNIDYLTLGYEDQKTKLSGLWDQRRTNVIVESLGKSENSIVQRLGYNSPMNYNDSDFTGAFNWVGAPWQFNMDSLNGTLSMKAEDGQITEVDDKGARLLSFFSLEGIRRSVNLEFGNIFSKGLGFDRMSLSANITNGILKNDDYFLDGSAGRIAGKGLIDLPNLNVNYRFSYSPAVTSSLPVLAAFAINPLTGAAVLMLTKILEPVVDTIIRVDFSVTGPISNPDIKIEDSQKGTVKLENSNVLDELKNSK
jgi:uncharacterized protein (TIGR02099 family)